MPLLNASRFLSTTLFIALLRGPTLRIVWYLPLQINFPWFCKKCDFGHFLDTFWHPKCSLWAPIGAQREAKAAQKAQKKRTLEKDSKKELRRNPPAFGPARSLAPPPPNPLLFLSISGQCNVQRDSESLSASRHPPPSQSGAIFDPPSLGLPPF